MVALGDTRNGQTNNVEIIDLVLPKYNCNNFPAYPFATERAKGELDFQEYPFICGGFNPHRNECKTFQNGEWRSFESMTEARHDFAITKLPFDSKLLLSGGHNGQNLALATAETLTKNGFDKALLKLPVEIRGHCMIVMNSSRLILLGGLQNGAFSVKTHILNTENLLWLEGPQLKSFRDKPGCGKISKDGRGTEQSIIVAGGFYNKPVSSIEILDVGSSEW